jgi:hypothetical protein
MPGIYLTAVLTTAIAAASFGPLIHKLRLPANERLLWLAAAIALPLQPLVFFCVRMPLDHWLVAHLNSTKATYYQWLITFYAPLTEEPAKLVPLLIPLIYRDIRAENFARYALAIGSGFGIGEMWFVADRVARLPEFASLPFYHFGAFVGERLMVCVFSQCVCFRGALGVATAARAGLCRRGCAALAWQPTVVPDGLDVGVPEAKPFGRCESMLLLF